ncbi:hybrid sensor histidine kinase/response regulator [Anabaena subtropica]|uniref:histidine kinase n=1 Tax=Anabaena subtropica FACHB-260 TaxID=2692884 RepID=A0ABR8CNR5_9NOST|nr:PAS domain S-box protein [Anabaena subtropica]MBD2344867.1 PAS domain S-box protein [Anabaena subtropica FACHB-260]
MLNIQRSHLQRSCISIVSVLLALLLGLLLERGLKVEISPLFFASVVFSSWYGGLAPGLFAAFLAILVKNYFFVVPFYSLGLSQWSDILNLIVFASVALLISSLNSQIRAARQVSEAKLAKLRVSHHQLLETAHEGIWIFDHEGKTEYVNPQLAKMLGYSIEQIGDRSIFDFIAPQQRLEIEQWLKQQQRHHQQTKQQFDLCLQRHDGSPLWVIISLSSILDQHSQFSDVMGYTPPDVMAMLTDITERKQSEETLAQEQAKRDLEGQRLRAILDILPMGVLIADAKGKLLEINPGVKAIWGEEAPLLDNTSQYHEYKGWWADTGKPLAAKEWTLARTLATGEAIIGEEIDIETFDGQRKTILNFAIPICDETGAILNVVVVNVDITERKRVEAALRQSEALAKARAEELETIMETVPAAVWIAHDPQCHFMTVNKTAYEMMRMSPGSPMTATPASGEYPFPFKIQKNGQDIPLNELAMQQAGLTGQEVEAEFEFVFSKEDVRYIYGKSTPVRDTDGNVRGVIGAFLDVTDRQQAEAALQESEARLKQLLQSSIIGIIEADSERINFANDAFLEIVGYTHEDLLTGKLCWQDMTPPEYSELDQAKVEEVLNSGFCTPFEKEYIRKDGSRVPILLGAARLSVSPLRWVCFILDLTERKQAEAALQQSELMFRTLANTMPQMFWITQPNGYHEYFNQRWYDYTGMTLEQAQGEGWQNILHTNDVQATMAHWQDCVQTGKNYDIECRLRRAADGEYRWHLARAFPLRHDNGQILKWFGSCTDIHDQKLAIEERAQAWEQERAARIELEQANRMKDDFLAIVSHELRSPLNPILGWAKLLKSHKLDTFKTHQALEVIERNAKLQARLIDDLLDVSRILRGKLSLNVCTVDLANTVESALETVRLTAEGKSIHIETELTSNVCRVEGDPNRLQQVVWNLLSNAVKFTPDGGRIEVKLERIGSLAQIQVSDTGKGISLDFLPYVFERFRQADEVTTRKFGGLGLGLAIVRHLVELHGGSVQVTSPGEGLGTTFTVNLPLIVASQVYDEYFAPDTTPNLQGLRIVVVDDDPDTLELLSFILEQYGVEVKAVNSANEALQAIAQTKPDLLLSDIGMPEVDGYMLIQQVRAMEVASDTKLPAIALTAFAGETNFQKIISAGFQRHLTKPVEPLELATVIANLIYSNS